MTRVRALSSSIPYNGRSAATKQSLLSCSVLMMLMYWGQAAVAAEPPITAIEIAERQGLVMVGSQAGLSVLRLSDLQPLKQIDCRLGHIHDLSLSPSGEQLLIGGGDAGEVGIVQCRSLPDLELKWENRDADDLVTGVTWLTANEQHSEHNSEQHTEQHTKQRLAAASWDRQVRTYLVKDRAVELECSYAGHSGPVTAVCSLVDGPILSAASDETLQLWRPGAASDKNPPVLIRNLHQHTAGVIAVSIQPFAMQAASLPAGPLLTASIGEDRTIRFWDVPAGRLVRFKKWIAVPRSIAWIPGSKRVVVGDDRGRLFIVDASDTSVREIGKFEERIVEIVMEPGGKSCLIASGSAIERVRLPEPDR